MPQRSPKSRAISSSLATVGQDSDGSDDWTKRLPDRYKVIRVRGVQSPDNQAGPGRRTHQQTVIAQDLQENHPVVIRAVAKDQLSEDGLFRFENYMRTASQIRCPWYLQPLDWSTQGEDVYCVHRHVRAMSLRQILKRASSNGATESRFSLDTFAVFSRSLLEAVEELHSLDCVQQDFRLTQLQFHDEQARLACAGPQLFVEPQRRPEDWSLRISEFASPELSGLIEHDIGAASDIYSAGIVMFFLLTGELPFVGKDLSTILFQHLTARPNMSLLEGAPSSLSQIVGRMLSKEPRDRYQSAAAVIYDLDQFCKIYHGELNTDQFVLGRNDPRDTITDPAFVGRRKELRQLRHAIDTTKAGGYQNVIVQCDSGIGKTRLVVESLRHADSVGCRIYRGFATAEAGQKPAAALQEIFQQVVAQPRLHARLRKSLTEYQTEISTALPDVAAALGWPRGDEPAGDQGKRSAPAATQTFELAHELDSFGLNRVNQAYCKILANLATSESPALIWIDDCQWLDPQTIDVLYEFQKSSPPHSLIVLSMRQGVEAAPVLLSTLEPTHLVELQPLSKVELQGLIESMAGHLPLDAVNTVLQLSGGSPFVASAILRGMVESGALSSEGSRWLINPDKMSDIQASSDSAEAILNRLQQFPSDVSEVLSIAAVIGREFNARSLTHLSDLSPQETSQHLKWARRQRLIWARPDGTYAFAHDRIRETLVARLEPADRKRLHLRLAETLASKRKRDDYALAYHFDAAGAPKRALPYALRAAKVARQTYSLEPAIRLLRIAVRAIPIADQSQYRETVLELAEALMLNGQYDEADLSFQKASLIETSTEGLAKIDMQRGELAFRQGDKEHAVLLMERSLERLNRKLPLGRVGCVARLVWELFVQAAHTGLPRFFVGRKQSPPSETERMTWRLYSRLAHGYWYTRSKPFVFLAHLRGMNLAERYGATPELGQAWSEHAPGMSLIPWRKRGTQYALRSLKMRQELGDVWGEGQSRGFYSILLHATSQFDQCVHQAQQAESILVRTGDYWEVNIARYQLASALYRRGNFKEAVEVAQRTYREALRIGDYQSTGDIIDVWARANGCQLPAGVLEREQQRPIHDRQSQIQKLLAEGVHWIGQGRFSVAITCFESAIQMAEQTEVVNAYTTPNYVWLATALRMQWLAHRPTIHAERNGSVWKLNRAVTKALRVASRFQNDLPHAWREVAYAAHIDGRNRRARQALEKSIRIATDQDAKYECALSQLAYGELGEELGWPDAKSMKQTGRLQRNAIERNSVMSRPEGSISLVDRFDALLDAGRRITSSLDEPRIFAEVRDAAQHLLRGQQTLIASRNSASESWRVETASDGGTIGLDRQGCQLMDEATAQKRTLVRDRATENRADPSSGQGTLLCSPIQTQGTVDTCLLVSNRLMQGIFRDNEIRIADYLTSAAGSALEKAQAFQQLEQLNQSLEQKVLERTETIEARSHELELTATRLRATQTKLEAARDESEAANRAKSEFLARMSHEIRTPISAVLGFTELMLRGVVKPEAHAETLQTIQTSGDHLLQLVNDLLDLSKIEANKLEVEQIEMIPARQVHEVVVALQARAKENGNDLQFEVDGMLPAIIMSDPKRFQQIVTNVVGNAIKFTTGGTIEVSMRLVAGPYHDERRQVEISVVDSGIGMTQAQVANIFDPFVQADSSTTRRFGGTGLGLSISRQLAESLGGNIEVSSVPGVGSRFTIRVDAGVPDPNLLLQPEQTWRVIHEQTGKDCLSVDLNGMRVFVADDAETNRDLLALMLRDSGATVELVENGRLAVQALLQDLAGSDESESCYDVVLMDMQMPVLDGYSASRELRDAGFEPPIIALTANSMKGDREKCLEAGCSDYLSKPIDFSELIARLAEIAEVDTKVITVGRQTSALSETAVNDRSVVDGEAAEDQVVSETAETVESRASTVAEELADDQFGGSVELPMTEPFRSFAIKFLGKLRDRHAEFVDAIESRDSEAAALLAHWATGTSGTVGLTDLSEQFRALEHAARDSDWDCVDSAFAALREHLEVPAVTPASCS